MGRAVATAAGGRLAEPLPAPPFTQIVPQVPPPAAPGRIAVFPNPVRRFAADKVPSGGAMWTFALMPE